jgi:hypothetical protein
MVSTSERNIAYKEIATIKNKRRLKDVFPHSIMPCNLSSLFSATVVNVTMTRMLRLQPRALVLRFVCDYDDYKVEEDEVGGTCGTNGGEEERV